MQLTVEKCNNVYVNVVKSCKFLGCECNRCTAESIVQCNEVDQAHLSLNGTSCH